MVHKLPEELISQWSYTTTLSRNLVISPSTFADTIMAFAAYPPNNILAVAEGNP